MKGFAEAASKRGADLILFHEMCLMGCDYFMSADIPQESKHTLVEPFDGPSAQAMAEISKKYGNEDKNPLLLDEQGIFVLDMFVNI